MGMFLCRCHCCSVLATSRTSHDSQPEPGPAGHSTPAHTQPGTNDHQVWGRGAPWSVLPAWSRYMRRCGISQALVKSGRMKGGLRINPGSYLSILGVYLVRTMEPNQLNILLQHYLFCEIPQPDFIWNCEKCEVFVCQRLQPSGYYGGFQSKSIRLLSEDSCVKSIKAGLLTS